ncbi:MAG: DNA-3-methyladenine glycosylase I [Lachnospiraceae bacterium]|nr:DNA-3-methyladenine glycosylase I [Lachnospiraceae bacterium]
MENKQCRCNWGTMSPKMQEYHDKRWCKQVHDDNELFAMLILEGAQAGLSWSTIIEREDNYRIAFDGFDPVIVAAYDDKKKESLMQNEGIIRNRLKINAAVTNAIAFLKVKDEFGSFDKYIWSFTDGKVIDHKVKDMSEVPATSELSERVSRELKKRGFKFVGATIIYSYLQGIGVYNDHAVDCDFR